MKIKVEIEVKVKVKMTFLQAPSLLRKSLQNPLQNKKTKWPKDFKLNQAEQFKELQNLKDHLKELQLSNK